MVYPKGLEEVMQVISPYPSRKECQSDQSAIYHNWHFCDCSSFFQVD